MYVRPQLLRPGNFGMSKTWIHTAATAWSSRSLSSWNCCAWPIFSTDMSRGRTALPSVQKPGKRESSPRNQEKETGCRDIWVATVAELCYIFCDPMFAHHHDCVSRGALWRGAFLNLMWVCSSSATMSVYWWLADEPEYCFWHLVALSLVTSMCMHGPKRKPTVTNRAFCNFLRDRSEWQQEVNPWNKGIQP